MSRKRLNNDGGQRTLEGKTIIEMEQEQILEQFEDKIVQCPFCFARQNQRAMKVFLDGEKTTLSKMAHCNYCKKAMRPKSIEVISYGGYEFGKFVGLYGGFWKIVDHDKWMHNFKKQFSQQFQDQFWKGYGVARPDFAEKQRIDKEVRAYEEEKSKAGAKI